MPHVNSLCNALKCSRIFCPFLHFSTSEENPTTLTSKIIVGLVMMQEAVCEVTLMLFPVLPWIVPGELPRGPRVSCSLCSVRGAPSVFPVAQMLPGFGALHVASPPCVLRSPLHGSGPRGPEIPLALEFHLRINSL